MHKPTFSEPHRQSLDWLVQKLPEAGLAAAIDGIGNVFGTSAKSGPKLLAGSHLESQNYAGCGRESKRGKSHCRTAFIRPNSRWKPATHDFRYARSGLNSEQRGDVDWQFRVRQNHGSFSN